jgi:hypothetical protein
MSVYICSLVKKRSAKFPVVAVIGHLVKDEILTLDGRSCSSLGGTAYNLAALAAIQKTGIIYPVCRFGNDIEKKFSELIGLSPLIDVSLVKRIRRPNVVNRLVYCSDGSREEWNSRRQSALKFELALDKCDAILLNFISGRDVKLRDFLAFRKRFRGLIYCDYHSLSLGYGPDRRRIRRYHPRWRDYISATDIIQMNIFELSTIAGINLKDKRDVFKACEFLHKTGPEIVIITSGREGVMMSISGRFYHVPAIRIGKEMDATGCGDTLSASFLQSHLLGKKPIESLEYANLYAAAKATFSGLMDFGRIDSIIAKIGPRTKAVRIF